LNARAACRQHAVHRHRFMKVGCSRQQFVEREAFGGESMALAVLGEVPYRFADAQPPDRIEGAGI
jgi:hypothetical protein